MLRAIEESFVLGLQTFFLFFSSCQSSSRRNGMSDVFLARFLMFFSLPSTHIHQVFFILGLYSHYEMLKPVGNLR